MALHLHSTFTVDQSQWNKHIDMMADWVLAALFTSMPHPDATADSDVDMMKDALTLCANGTHPVIALSHLPDDIAEVIQSADTLDCFNVLHDDQDIQQWVDRTEHPANHTVTYSIKLTFTGDSVKYASHMHDAIASVFASLFGETLITP